MFSARFSDTTRLTLFGAEPILRTTGRLSLESHMTRIPRALLAAAVLATISPSIVALRAQSDARERAMYVSVVNDAGDPVEGLGPDAFIVREDGIRREVLRGFEKRDSPRAVLLPVLTDGVEFTNMYDRTVLDALKKSGAALYAVTIGTFVPGPRDELRYRAIVLDQGPRITGGYRETVLSSTAVEQTLKKMARELSSQYKVVYGRPPSLIPPEKVEVSVTRP